MPLPLELVLFGLFGLLAIAAFFANAIIIWIVLRHEVMRKKAANWQVLNLAVSDICLIFCTIPLYINNVHESWLFPIVICHLFPTVYVILFLVSVYTIVLISLDRYHAIFYPLHCRHGSRQSRHHFTFIALPLIWLLAILFALPKFTFTHFYPNELVIVSDKKGGLPKLEAIANFCHPHFDDPYKIYNFVLVFLQFLLPILILAYTNCRIAFELYHPKIVPSEGSINQMSILKAKRRTAKLFVLLVFSFFAAWFPYQVMLILPKRIANNWPIGTMIILNVDFLLSLCSTIISPIIYFIMSKRFRSGFCYALRWMPFLRVNPIITNAQYRDAFAL